MAEDTKEKNMSQNLKLPATVRVKTGKNANRKLRATGMTPAVFYTPEGENKVLQVNEALLMKLYKQVGRTTMFDLEIDDNGKTSTHPCLVWDIEHYPTKSRFQHVDFYGVDLTKELKIRVPLVFIGTAKGTKLGGKLEVYREEIYILSKPQTLPKQIPVDISELGVGDGLRVEDLAMPEGVRPHYDNNFAILNVLMPGAGKGDAQDEDEK